MASPHIIIKPFCSSIYLFTDECKKNIIIYLTIYIYFVNYLSEIMKMTVKELAVYVNLSPQTIYNLVCQNKIPFKRVSEKKVQFEKDEIDAWLKQRNLDKVVVIRARKNRRIAEKTSIPASIEAACALEVISTAPSTLPPPASPESIFSGTLVHGRSSPASFFGVEPSILGAAKAPDPDGRRNPWLIPLILLLIVPGWVGGFLYFRSRVHKTSALAASVLPVGLNAEAARIDTLDYVPAPAGGSKVRAASVPRGGGLIQIKLDYLSQIIEVDGPVGSPQIKALLIKALKSNEEKYSVKSKSIDIVQPYYADSEIRGALLHILARDGNPVIRMKAMTVLAKISSNPEIKSALLERLKNDTNIGVRYKALELIENDVDGEILSVLKILKEKETDKIIKERAGTIYEAYDQRKKEHNAV
jgi:excisionase family DNA binding protein